MRQTLRRKALEALLVIPGIVTLVFLIFSLLGDPARLVAGQRSDLATLTTIREELGLDQPVWRRYLAYLNDLSPIGWLSPKQKQSGNYRYWGWGSETTGSVVLKSPYLGRSFQSRRAVLGLYFERLPTTLLLASVSLLLAAGAGIPLGVVAAQYANRWQDRALSMLAFVGVSAPSFFVGIGLLALLAVSLYAVTGLPTGGFITQASITGDGTTLDFRYLVLPVLTLGIRPLSIVFQLTRAGMLSTYNEDYIRTARSKGLTESRIRWRHALPNTLTPVLTALSGWLASLLAGTFFVEAIFDWPGIGKLTVDALYTSDFPVIAGVCLATGLLFLAVNTAMDLLYPLLDPRVRVS